MFSRSSAAGRSNGYASGLGHAFETGVHFFFFNKVTALGCRDSFFHGSEEAGFFAKVTDNKIRHQPLGDGPCLTGDLRNLCLLLGSEVDFHGVRVRKNLVGGKGMMIGGYICAPEKWAPAYRINLDLFDFMDIAVTLLPQAQPTHLTLFCANDPRESSRSQLHWGSLCRTRALFFRSLYSKVLTIQPFFS